MITKTVVGTGSGLIMLSGGRWKILGPWTRKEVEHFKWGLKGHPSKLIKESSADSDWNCGDLVPKVSDGNSTNISSWPTDHSCDPLAKTVTYCAIVLRVCLRLS